MAQNLVGKLAPWRLGNSISIGIFTAWRYDVCCVTCLGIQIIVRRYLGLEELVMAKTLERKDVSGLVLKIVQGWHFDTEVTEDTDFSIDIPIDSKVKGLYYYAIRINFEKLGYQFCDFSPADCEAAETIGDIVDAVWADLNPQSQRSM
jgi:hypothetical protein